ncbi:MAG: hydantoinase B/oxoprolinase family protein [Actinomycetota bacterium]|nr:hydantoinase B/oxoprolinase family protein [Actinomycetota bacterium]
MLDPVSLSVLQSALAGIAEEMGALLVRTSYSSNIKERKDCSAALFDAAGTLVAQAEHIPVHLGAMPETVAAVALRDPGPGDVFIVNDPFTGGSHLPDITLVSVLWHERERIGYAVTRAHHSDVGGMQAGSMPADSSELFQEGIIIPPVRLVRDNGIRDDVLQLILANCRTPELRRGDLRAQLAANRLAATRLDELIHRRGRATVLAGFEEVVAYGERRAREFVSRLEDGVYEASGEIEGDGNSEDDFRITASVAIEGEGLTVAFDGCAPQVAGNVNCPLAVTRAACFFALRVLLPPDMPSNEGVHRVMSVSAPERTLVNATRPAAVVAGNVETSQRIADTVLQALAQVADLPAQGQGTMNNLVIGGERWTYYETLGGGQGASSKGPGGSGVHVGMTNTLNTPIEAMELEYPLHVERYELVYGSGGEGRHRGGDGLVRVVRVMEDASLSLLADRRRHQPKGSAGGGDGSTGANLVNGSEVAPKARARLAAGDVVEVRTPGGGGWGEA